MKLKTYYRSLSTDQKKAYAKSIGYEYDYVRVHLIPATKDPDSTPPLGRLRKLADKSGGNVSFDEVVQHFEGASKRAA